MGADPLRTSQVARKRKQPAGITAGCVLFICFWGDVESYLIRADIQFLSATLWGLTP